MCSIPQQGFCHEKKDLFRPEKLAKNFLNETYENNAEEFLGSFDAFDKFTDLFEDGKKFLMSFLKEIHFHYGLNLSLKEACQLVRENIRSLDMPVEMQSVVLNTIALYESNNPTKLQLQKLECSAMIATGVCFPWEWGWGSLIKQLAHFQSPTCKTKEIEFPSDIYVGGAELLAGALCMIVGTVIPPFYAAGTILLGDGVNRVYNGVSQLGEERRSYQSYIKSASERLSFNSIEVKINP